MRRTLSAFFVFLWYCITRAQQCQYFFEKFLYILPGSWHTKGVHSKEKEVLSMAKNNQNKNQNKNQNQNQNQNQNKNQNQEQSKQAKECN